MKRISDSEHSAIIPEPQPITPRQPSTLFLIVSQMPAAMLFTSVTAFLWFLIVNETPIGPWLCPRAPTLLAMSGHCASNPVVPDFRIIFSLYTAIGVASGLWALNRMIQVRGSWLFSLGLTFVISYFESSIIQATPYLSQKSLMYLSQKSPIASFVTFVFGPVLIGVIAPIAFHILGIIFSKRDRHKAVDLSDFKNAQPLTLLEAESPSRWSLLSKGFLQTICTCGAIYAGGLVYESLSFSVPGPWAKVVHEMGTFPAQFFLALFASIGCIYIGALLRLPGKWANAVILSWPAGTIIVKVFPWPWIYFVFGGDLWSPNSTSRIGDYFLLLAGAVIVTLGYHLNHLFKKKPVAHEPPTHS